jgi:hypothetical protein
MLNGTDSFLSEMRNGMHQCRLHAVLSRYFSCFDDTTRWRAEQLLLEDEPQGSCGERSCAHHEKA